VYSLEVPLSARKTKEHMEEDSWEEAGKLTDLERSKERGTRSGGVAEYRRRPVLRQELKGKEEDHYVQEIFNHKPNYFSTNNW